MKYIVTSKREDTADASLAAKDQRLTAQERATWAAARATAKELPEKPGPGPGGSEIGRG